MGYLDENTVVLIKNLYILLGLWLALRFLIYILRERPTNPYAAIGMVIAGYSAVITYSYGTSTELGEPKFYLDWIITVPLIFLSFIFVDYERTKDQTAFQFALTLAGTAVFFLIYMLREGDPAQYDEAFAVMTGIFVIGMVIALISIDIETYPLSNPTVPILILLFAYPFLYFYSTSEPWTGFEREFFEGSYLHDLGLNWFDLIGILFLLSFICKFWLSWYHVVSNDRSGYGQRFTLIGDLSVQQDGDWTDGTDVATTLFLGAGIIASVANWLRLYAGENQALLLSLLLIVLAIVFFFSRIYVVRSAK